jgi:hypothetical protein
MQSKRAVFSTAFALAAAVALGTPAGSADAQIIGSLTASAVGTTIPLNGDVNPYGVAVVPTTIGNLTAGNILVSNFNNLNNAQGTGTTIAELSPTPSSNPSPANVFAQISLPGSMKCPGGVGLTTALVALKSGWVIVGSLPTMNGSIANAGLGCLIVLNPEGEPVETFSGGDIAGPWDMTALDNGSSADLFVTNVLNGLSMLQEPSSPVVNQGTVVRLHLILPSPTGHDVPHLTKSTIIGSGFSEQANTAALIIGPTGVGLGGDGTLYVADTLVNRIAGIPDADTRTTTAYAGEDVSSGGLLNGPLGLAIAPNGDILTVNANDSNMVETTPAGAQVDSNPTNQDGGGVLFGLAVQDIMGKLQIYFVDDGINNLNVLQ